MSAHENHNPIKCRSCPPDPIAFDANKPDGIERRWHVRERDNRAAVVLSKPGWAITSGQEYWYLHIEDLPHGGMWEYRSGSVVGGLNLREANALTEKTYRREAAKK